jgi:hypothetical protein
MFLKIGGWLEHVRLGQGPTNRGAATCLDLVVGMMMGTMEIEQVYHAKRCCGNLQFVGSAGHSANGGEMQISAVQCRMQANGI